MAVWGWSSGWSYHDDSVGPGGFLTASSILASPIAGLGALFAPGERCDEVPLRTARLQIGPMIGRRAGATLVVQFRQISSEVRTRLVAPSRTSRTRGAPPRTPRDRAPGGCPVR
jgi:hypothetical protein